MSRGVLLALILLAVPAYCLADTIRLKDGSTLEGKILREGSDSITIDCALGEVVVKRSNISSLDYGPTGEHQIRGAERIAGQLELMRLDRRLDVDTWALGTAYGLTVMGDLLMGGTFYAGSLVPVVGPFVNALTINEDDYGTDDDGASRDRALFLISGVVQTVAAIDYYRTSKRMSRLEERVNFSLVPSPTGLAIVARFP